MLKANGMSVISVLSATIENGMRQVKIRFRSPDSAALDAAIESFKKLDGLRYWLRDGKLYMKDEERPKA